MRLPNPPGRGAAGTGPARCLGSSQPTVRSYTSISAETGGAGAASEFSIERLMREQLQAMNQLFAKQLETLHGAASRPAASASAGVSPSVPQVPPRLQPSSVDVGSSAAASKPIGDETKPFGPYKPPQTSGVEGADGAAREASQRLDRSCHAAHGQIEKLDAGVPQGAGRPARRVGFPAAVEGDGLLDRHGPFEGFAHLGYRRQRVHRSRQRLRTHHARPSPGLCREGDRSAAPRGIRDRSADAARRRSGEDVLRNDRQRAHDVLQYRLGSRACGPARVADRDRPKQGRHVYRRLSRNVRRGSRQGLQEQGWRAAIRPDRAGHSAAERLQHDRARLRHGRIARMDTARMQAILPRCWSNRCRAVIPTCSRSNF